ncbi:MAG: hypothetical protein AAF567_08895 [Actinomycetota bacterium]
MLEQLPLTRIVSTPAALDALEPAAGSVILRTAPDEVLILDPASDYPAPVIVDDPHAIVVVDQGWAQVSLTRQDAEELLERHGAWVLPDETPAVAQGRIGNAPVKLWVEHDRVLLLVPLVAAHDLARLMEPDA